jgi:hypothetical protein
MVIFDGHFLTWQISKVALQLFVFGETIYVWISNRKKIKLYLKKHCVYLFPSDYIFETQSSLGTKLKYQSVPDSPDWFSSCRKSTFKFDWSSRMRQSVISFATVLNWCRSGKWEIGPHPIMSLCESNAYTLKTRGAKRVLWHYTWCYGIVEHPKHWIAPF